MRTFEILLVSTREGVEGGVTVTAHRASRQVGLANTHAVDDSNTGGPLEVACDVDEVRLLSSDSTGNPAERADSSHKPNFLRDAGAARACHQRGHAVTADVGVVPLRGYGVTWWEVLYIYLGTKGLDALTGHASSCC
jgi:hypothetical protein